MSSLRCAAAAPGLAIPSHFFASPFHCRANQRFAFASRLNSMPSPSPAPQRFAFASQNVALPRRCHSAPCVAVAHLLKSRQCRCNANHIGAFLCHSFALPVCASQCRREAVGRNALPLHSSSPHSLRKASPCLALPRRCHSAPCVAVAHLLKSRQCRCNANHCCAAQSHRTANLTQPCHCQAVHRTASANPGRQCHALALRLSPHMRCK